MKRRTRISIGLLGLVVLLLALLGGWLLYKQFQDRQLPFETLDRDEGGLGYTREQPGLMVFVRAGEIEAAGLDANNTARLHGQLFTVDYQREFVVVAFQGVRGSGGFDISVQRIWQIGNDVYIQARFVEPGRDSRVTLGLTSPYHMVTVARASASGQTIRFVLLRGSVSVVETTRYIP